MEILFDKKENASALLTISMDQADYQSDYKSKVKEYSKRVQMKGFRPGKVPAELVERMYGPALKSEAINALLNKSIDQYIKEHDIDVLGDIISDESEMIPEDQGATTPLKFSFLMAIRPEISYPKAETLEMVYPEIEVSADKVEDFITDLQKRYGKMVAGNAIGEGDLIKGQLKAADGTFEVESSFPFSRIKEGYRSQFIGKTIGETIEFPIEEAFEENEIKFVTNTYKDKDRTFSGLFSLTISGVDTQEPAELTEDFFEKAVGKGKASNIEEFRQRVKELFESTYATESKAYFTMKLEKTLFEQSQMVLAEDVITKVIRSRVKEKMTEEELQDFLPRYMRSMKMSLIKNQVAEDNQIRLSEEDLLDAAKDQIATDFQQMGYGNLDDEFLGKYAVNYLNEKDKNNRDRMAEKALSAKIATAVLEKGKIVRKPVSIEEFNQLVEELN